MRARAVEAALEVCRGAAADTLPRPAMPRVAKRPAAQLAKQPAKRKRTARTTEELGALEAQISNYSFDRVFQVFAETMRAMLLKPYADAWDAADGTSVFQASIWIQHLPGFLRGGAPMQTLEIAIAKRTDVVKVTFSDDKEAVAVAPTGEVTIATDTIARDTHVERAIAADKLTLFLKKVRDLPVQLVVDASALSPRPLPLGGRRDFVLLPATAHKKVSFKEEADTPVMRTNFIKNYAECFELCWTHALLVAEGFVVRTLAGEVVVEKDLLHSYDYDINRVKNEAFPSAVSSSAAILYGNWELPNLQNICFLPPNEGKRVALTAIRKAR